MFGWVGGGWKIGRKSRDDILAFHCLVNNRRGEENEGGEGEGDFHLVSPKTNPRIGEKMRKGGH